MECPVCLNDYTEIGAHEPLVITDCGHSFCSLCLGANDVEMGNRRKLERCPFCQTQISNTIRNFSVIGLLGTNVAELELMLSKRRILEQEKEEPKLRREERKKSLLAEKSAIAGKKKEIITSIRTLKNELNVNETKLKNNDEDAERITMEIDACDNHTDAVFTNILSSLASSSLSSSLPVDDECVSAVEKLKKAYLKYPLTTATALETIAQLAHNNKANRPKFSRIDGCFEAILSAMRVHGRSNVDVFRQGCVAISRLLSGGKDNDAMRMRRMFGAIPGGLDIIVSVFLFHGASDADVVKDACTAITYLSCNNPQNSEALERSADLLVCALQSFGTNPTHADVTANIANAIGNLAHDSSVNQIKFGNIPGCCEAMVSALQSFGPTHAKVAKIVSVAIGNLAHHSGNRTKLGDIPGCCEAMVSALQSFGPTDANVAKSIVYAVDTLAAKSPANVTKFGNTPGCCEAMVSSLQSFGTTDAAVAKLTALAIGNLAATSPANQTKFGDIPGCCEAIVSALQLFGTTDAKIAEDIAYAIGRLAVDSPANRSKFGNIPGCCGALVSALRSFGTTHADVAKWGSYAITHLITGNRSNKDKFVSLGCVGIIQNLQRLHPTVDEIGIARKFFPLP